MSQHDISQRTHVFQVFRWASPAERDRPVACASAKESNRGAIRGSGREVGNGGLLHTKRCGKRGRGCCTHAFVSQRACTSGAGHLLGPATLILV
eukprot:365168-Chlamydomonas_euryale.AAC.8